MNTYGVNEVFYSLQGEGMRAGEASVFVRFSGCNQTCRVESHGFDCDTEFVSSTKLSLDELLCWIEKEAGACRWVVFTGGEPGLQLDEVLVVALHQKGFFVAIETNGSVNISELGIDWITVSPKVAEHAIKQKTANEVKYVRGFGQGVPRPSCKATYKLISPATQGEHIDLRALDWCVNLVKQNTSWRLSVQQHKLWRVR